MARTFDGVDDEGAGLMSADISTAFTIGAWIKPVNAGANYGRLMNIRNDAANDESVFLFNSGSSGAPGIVKAAMENESGSIYYGPTHAAMVMDGRWYYHVTRWSSGSGVRTTVYNADGTVHSDVTGSNQTLTVRAAVNGEINVAHSGGGSRWAGSVARLFVHNAVLTDAQVATLMDSKVLPVTPSGDYWEFGAGDSDMTETGEVNGEVLTITGAASTSDAGLPSTVLPVAPTKMADVSDEFDTLNTTLWDVPGSAVTLTNGEVVVKQLDYYPGLYPNITLDALDSAVHAAVRPDTNVTGSSREDALQVGAPSDNANRAMLMHAGSTIFGRTYSGGSAASTNSLTYDPVQHLYRRIRYVGGQGFHFDLAPGPTGPWTTLPGGPLDVPWNVREVELVLWAGFWKAGETTDKVVRFDKLNITVRALVLQGSLAPQGSAPKRATRGWAGSIAPTGETIARRVVFRVLAGAVALAGAASKHVPALRGGTIALRGGDRGDGTFSLRTLLSKAGSVSVTATRDSAMGITKGGTLQPQGSRVQNFLGRVFGQAGTVVLRAYAKAAVRLRIRRPN